MFWYYFGTCWLFWLLRLSIRILQAIKISVSFSSGFLDHALVLVIVRVIIIFRAFQLLKAILELKFDILLEDLRLDIELTVFRSFVKNVVVP